MAAKRNVLARVGPPPARDPEVDTGLPAPGQMLGDDGRLAVIVFPQFRELRRDEAFAQILPPVKVVIVPRVVVNSNISNRSPRLP